MLSHSFSYLYAFSVKFYIELFSNSLMLLIPKLQNRNELFLSFFLFLSVCPLSHCQASCLLPYAPHFLLSDLPTSAGVHLASFPALSPTGRGWTQAGTGPSVMVLSECANHCPFVLAHYIPSFTMVQHLRLLTRLHASGQLQSGNNNTGRSLSFMSGKGASFESLGKNENIFRIEEVDNGTLFHVSQ